MKKTWNTPVVENLDISSTEWGASTQCGGWGQPGGYRPGNGSHYPTPQPGGCHRPSRPSYPCRPGEDSSEDDLS